MFKSVVKGVAFAGAMALASTAMADGFARGSVKDRVVAAPFSWTGFYVGVNAGYAWGESDTASSFPCPAGAGCTIGLPANIAAVAASGSGSFSGDGFTGGVQAGYNWQSGSTVLGVEIDYNALNLNGTRVAGGPFPATPANSFRTTTSIDTDWLFTARVRLGWTLSPTVLVYATGGLAVADVRVATAYSDNFAVPAAGASGRSDTRTGWTVGGGVEVALNRNWTFKGEYLFVDLGDVSTSTRVQAVGFNPNFLNTSHDITAHIARAGINYKF